MVGIGSLKAPIFRVGGGLKTKTGRRRGGKMDCPVSPAGDANHRHFDLSAIQLRADDEPPDPDCVLAV